MALAQDATIVKGNVFYRERMALPANAYVSVRLEEVGAADAPSRVVSEVGYMTGGKNVPLPYQLTWMPGVQDSRNKYYVRATISVDGKVMFRSVDSYEVAAGIKKNTDILVKREGTLVETPNLQYTKWILHEINGKPIKTDGRAPEITLKDGVLGSNTGVNTMGGEYTIKDKVLTIKPGMQTMMAGSEEAMKLERAFVSMLGKVTTWTFKGQELELRSGTTVVARFSSRQR